MEGGTDFFDRVFASGDIGSPTLTADPMISEIDSLSDELRLDFMKPYGSPKSVGSPRPLLDIPTFSVLNDHDDAVASESKQKLSQKKKKKKSTSPGDVGKWSKGWRNFARNESRSNSDGAATKDSVFSSHNPSVSPVLSKLPLEDSKDTTSAARRRRRKGAALGNKYFGITESHRNTAKEGAIVYWKVKLKCRGMEFYVGTCRDLMEAVVTSDATYLLVGEFQKSNIMRSGRISEIGRACGGSFSEYVKRLASSCTNILHEKLVKVKREKIQTQWRDAVRSKWGSVVVSATLAAPSASEIANDDDEEFLKPLRDLFGAMQTSYGIVVDLDNVDAFMKSIRARRIKLKAVWSDASLVPVPRALPSTSSATRSGVDVSDRNPSTASSKKSGLRNDGDDSIDHTDRAIEMAKKDIMMLRRKRELLLLQQEKKRLELLYRQQRELFREQDRQIEIQMKSAAEDDFDASETETSRSAGRRQAGSIRRNVSFGSLPRATVRNRCRKLFSNEGHDPRMCFQCAHCDHASWTVEAETTLDGEDNEKTHAKKRRAVQKSSQPLAEALHRNRVYYHGNEAEYKKLEYPFCVMSAESIRATKNMFRFVAKSFNPRYCGRDSPPGTEELLVLQLVEMQKTINDIYMKMAEGERVVTDGILGRCTMRHLAATGKIHAKHASFLSHAIPGIMIVVKAANALAAYYSETNDVTSDAEAPTSRVVIDEEERESLAKDLKDHFLS